VLAFITSVRNPHNSTDYERVEMLLQRTLKSVCSQIDRDFRVIVVASRAPSFALPENVEVIVVDFPPPDSHKGPQIKNKAIRRDKGTKLAVGLLAARRLGATHVMQFDADDFVSRHISAFVNAHAEQEGWYFDRGYVLYERRGLLKGINNFHENCGTSFVLRQDLYGPADLELDATQDEIYEAFGEDVVTHVLGSHLTTLAHFAARGIELAPLPFPGATYVVETGENWSGGVYPGFGWPVRPSLTREFGFSRPPVVPSILSLLASAPALAQRRRQASARH
jgi:hypothetical protein